MEIIEYLVERGSDTEFEFNWFSNFYPGFGDAKGTTMDFILAIQKILPNFFLLTEVRYYTLIITFK
jgi:hypothetical protein